MTSTHLLVQSCYKFWRSINLLLTAQINYIFSDCSKPCPAGSTLSDCSICTCDDVTVIGRVWTKENPQTPIGHVAVYVVGHDWEVTTYTNNTGHFQLNDICTEGLEIRVDMQGLVSEEMTYNYNDFTDGNVEIFCSKNGNTVI